MIQMRFGVTGDARKRLVKAIADHEEDFSSYLGAPTFDYVVGMMRIDRNGTVTFEEEPPKGLIEYLADRGFTPEGTEEEMDRLTIEMPRDGFTEDVLANLQKMVDSKASLLKKSLGTEDLTIEVTDERIRFPWFPADQPEKAETWTKLVAAICRAAKEAKRVTSTDREVESEKYAFRTWLLRLGFIGAEYKEDRKILMENLSGTAAFKNQADADAFLEKQKAKRDAKKAQAEGE